MKPSGTFHRRRLVAATAVVVVLGAVVPAVTSEDHAGAAAGSGFRFVGSVPTSGALAIDEKGRLGLAFNGKVELPGGSEALQWATFDLDRVSGGRFESLRELQVVESPASETCETLQELPSLPTAIDDTAKAQICDLQVDRSRLQVNTIGTEPLVAVDPAASRLFYVARGAVYEVSYDTARLREAVVACGAGGAGDCLSKWVGPPNVGISHQQAFVPSGFAVNQSTEGVRPASVAYDSRHGEQALYVMGDMSNSLLGASGTNLVTQPVWFAGWDASPGNRNPDLPERRQQWFYVARSCVRLANQRPNGMAPLVRSGDWLYTVCDATADGGSRGVLRVHLSTVNPVAPGRMAPDGTEQFFPGVSGIEVEALADPASERVYVMSRNLAAGGRSVVVFDGRAGRTQGDYTGAFNVVSQSADAVRAASAGFDPGTGRWFFQSQEGLFAQAGRLPRIAQPRRFTTDTDGEPLGFAAARALRVDPATDARGARVLISKPEGSGRCGATGCYEVYEELRESAVRPQPPTEITLNVPESPDLSARYDGVVSATGLKVRVVRGLSTLWPSGVPGVVNLEDPNKQSPPEGATDYLTDPFFYHEGDCTSADRELAFGRVFNSTLSSNGIDLDDGSARALAVDPDIHRKGLPDDTRTRDDLANPDRDPVQPGEPGFATATEHEKREGCVRRFFETMAHPMPGSDRDPADGNFNDFGQSWPFETVECSDPPRPGPEGDSITDADADSSSPSTAEDQNLLSTAVSGSAAVRCQATGVERSLVAETRASVSPAEASAIVSVGDTQTRTSVTRTPGQGLKAEAESITRGVSIAGVVHLDEVRAYACVHAPGYQLDLPEGEAFTSPCTGQVSPEVNSTHLWAREFVGLSLQDPVTKTTTRVCGACSAEQVVEAVNDALAPAGVGLPSGDAEAAATISSAIGAFGWARAPEPEAEFRRLDANMAFPTTKGTLAVVQKDFLRADADLTMNGDDSQEWTALEIGIYRDAQQRGKGRYIIQIGSVFSQAGFGVIPQLGDFSFLDVDTDLGPDLADANDTAVASAEDDTFVAGTTRTIVIPGDPAAATAVGGGGAPGLLEQIAEGLKKSLRAALLLAALWSIAFAPVYLARRRAMLRRLIGS